jgi:hypothetical protein
VSITCLKAISTYLAEYSVRKIAFVFRGRSFAYGYADICSLIRNWINLANFRLKTALSLPAKTGISAVATFQGGKPTTGIPG